MSTDSALHPVPPPPPPPPAAARPAALADDEQPLPLRLRVEPWDDRIVDHLGHDPRSAYVEMFWLPILGPSTTLLLRRIATLLDQEPDGTEVELAGIARSLGLGTQGGKRSAFVRAIDRSTQFGLAQQLGPSRLAVRRKVPPLTQRQVVRLPQPLQGQHSDWMHHHRPRNESRALQRARELALDLASSGIEEDDVERQLGKWGLHPAVAYAASRWAVQRQHEAIRALDTQTLDTQTPESRALDRAFEPPEPRLPEPA